MDLGEEIRNSIIMSAIGGFLIGISWFVPDTILARLPEDSVSFDAVAWVVGCLVFLIGFYIIAKEWHKKSSIVAYARAYSVGQTETD